jgi:hypothetical protein
MSMMLLGLFVFSSCEKDDDSNPTLQTPAEGSFVLNKPAAAEHNTYDLASSSTLELTVSQPNYGYTAPVTYAVQVATKEDFSNMTELATVYSKARMDVDASEIAVAVTQQLVDEGNDESAFPMTTPVYVRVRAFITDSQNTIPGTEILSNIVLLNSVKVAFSLPPLNVPEELYVIGSFTGWNWDTSLKAAHLYGARNAGNTEDTYWHLVYMDSDNGIKFNGKTAWDGGQVGYEQANSVVAPSGVTVSADKDGNFVADKGGWFLMIVKASVQGRKIAYDVDFQEPNVYIIGWATGSEWGSENPDDWKCTVPSTMGGEFVSPSLHASKADQGLRAYVKIGTHDPWHAEFMVFDKKIVYRGSGGDQERVQCDEGQKLYLNFSNDTGKIE